MPHIREVIAQLPEVDLQVDKSLAFRQPLLSENDRKKFARLTESSRDANNAYMAVAQVGNDPSEVEHTTGVYIYNLQLGYVLTMLHKDLDLYNFCIGHGMKDMGDKLLTTTKLRLDVISPRIDGIHLTDFDDPRYIEEKGLDKGFDFILEVGSSKKTSDTRDFNWAHVPSAVIYWFPDDYKKTDRDSTPALNALQSFHENLRDFGSKVRNKILHGTDPMSVSLREKTSRYLKDPTTKALLVALLSPDPYFRLLYRDIQSKAATDGENELWQEFMSAIESVRDNDALFSSVLEEEVVNGEQDEQEVVVSDIARNVDRLKSLSRQLEYDLDTPDLNWGSFSKAELMRFEIDQNSPQILRFEFSWKLNSVGGLDASIEINTRRKTFEWSFVDDPARKPYLVRSLQALALSMIDVLIKQKEQEAKDKHVVSQGPSEVAPKIKRVKPPSIIVEERKKKRNHLEDTSMQREPSVFKPIHERAVVKRIIELPEEEELEKFLKGFSVEDRALILKGIKEFNEEGIGEFKQYKSTKDHENMFALRTATTSPKGARVLLRESLSEKGRRTFQIVNIKKRGEVKEVKH